MRQTRLLPWLSPRHTSRVLAPVIYVVLSGAGHVACAQVWTLTSPTQAVTTTPVAPKGFTLHQTVDLGGHINSTSGSGAMYDTLVNIQSGPRVMGQTFELRALPDAKHTAFDSLKAFTTGFGGDPTNYTKLDINKAKLYSFSGVFRRHRDYFDYDLLGNPNIPSGQSIPIGPSNAPTGSLAWPQVNQSPFLSNTVRRMTDTSLTLFPLSQVSFRFGYSQNTVEGPGLSPAASGSVYNSVGSNPQLLSDYQRHSIDVFTAEVDWKPWKETQLTYEQEVEHIKENSFFTLSRGSFIAQEADGTKVAPGGWNSLAPYGISSCNTTSMGSGYTSATNYTILSPAQTPGGLPIINPACAVATNYLRSQPTRMLYPTEMFRFQSGSIRRISMNGDVRYTAANMNLPNYYENFQGLSGSIRSITYTGNASAKRKVTTADYGIVWTPVSSIRLSDQFEYSNAQQPGTSNISKGITATTPTTAGNQTINYSGALTSGTVTVEGSPNGTPYPNYFGQKFLRNNVTAAWEGWARTTFSLTYHYQYHVIAQGIPHNTPLPIGEETNGTVTIHENGGTFAVAFRPTTKWNVNGSVEVLYADNTFTPVSPRQLQHYRLHATYRPRTWATISTVYNDLERHNNTNNNQNAVATGVATYAGPIGHVDHNRNVSLGANLFPNDRYGVSFNYSYSDVYASTNICYDAASTSTLPGAASASGTACPGSAVRGTTYYEFGPVKDFMHAPTQYGFVALTFSPVNTIHTSLGYSISAVNGSRFFNDARDVNGSLVSTYQSPEASVAWTVHKGLIWRAEYRFYGYGEGGPSGAQYCSTSNPTPTAPVTVVPCNSASLVGLQTGLTISPAGETAPRNFHSNLVTLGLHYEF